MSSRVRIHVRGTVQGVGFRPFVYRHALAHGLAGWVRNDSSGVVIEVEGAGEDVKRFLSALPGAAPPASDIAEITSESIDPLGETAFAIARSETLPDALAEIPPDLGLCDDCRRELFDPADRRHRYAFINCTNCGPRFTIAERLPYDRPFTSMKSFAMCPECQREYDDPADRRFHAQPNACPVCGPQLELEGAEGDPIPAVVDALRAGKIAAIKGLGGFHLVVDATRQDAVAALRERKWRERKPFALMVRDIAAAREIAHVSADEERLLSDYRKPIVLCRKRDGHGLAEAVAPVSRFFGIMLPYTPIHAMLLDAGFRALVMTSANRTDEPIAIDNDEARERLGSVADVFLLHDRDIIRRSDDSVTRVFRGEPMVLRRARGYVPTAVPLAVEGSVLAVGGDLKNTLCIVRRDRAYVSQHIGDLDHADALAFFEETLAHFQGILEVQPRTVAHDLHPGYHATAFARRLDGATLVPVQHHHAHAASCMAEHGLAGPAIAVSLDGTGYGTDGAIWGGEFLIATLAEFERFAHLAYVPMPGGERAIREPWRMAVATLGDAVPELDGVEPDALRAVAEMVERGVSCPQTSSMGRLFDAVSALLGVCTHTSYEGQAAIELEAVASPDERGSYPVSLDPRELIRSVLGDLRAGVPVDLIARRFHNTIIALVRSVCGQARDTRGLQTVVLSGGCFQNVLLLEGCVAGLEADGFTVHYHRLVPTNDGGLSLGQAVVALARQR